MILRDINVHRECFHILNNMQIGCETLTWRRPTTSFLRKLKFHCARQSGNYCVLRSLDWNGSVYSHHREHVLLFYFFLFFLSVLLHRFFITSVESLDSPRVILFVHNCFIAGDVQFEVELEIESGARMKNVLTEIMYSL